MGNRSFKLLGNVFDLIAELSVTTSKERSWDARPLLSDKPLVPFDTSSRGFLRYLMPEGLTTLYGRKCNRRVLAMTKSPSATELELLTSDKSPHTVRISYISRD